MSSKLYRDSNQNHNKDGDVFQQKKSTFVIITITSKA